MPRSTIRQNWVRLIQYLHTLKSNTAYNYRQYKSGDKTMKDFLHELWINGRQPILYLLGVGILVLLLTPILTYLYFVRDLSSKENIINRKNEGLILEDRTGKPFFTFYEAKTKHTVPLSDISKQTQEAVIAIEDKDFYNHPGVSVSGIGRAIVADLKHESLAQGGSTISQQLVKNTLLTQEKSFLRKYQELFLALEIERRFSKEDILEMYLNTVYFGEGAFGIEDASRAYFSKDVSELTLAESALLAGILPAPSAYSPISGSKEKAFTRQKIVLQKMREQGFITQAQEDQALAQKIVFDPSTQALNVTAPHFAIWVKDQLIKKYGEQKVAQSGYTVKTTLDLAGQEYAQQVVESQVARLTRNDASNGAAVVMDPNTGEVLAMVGSHDWSDPNNGKINMTLSPRQPGSSFKPIVYADALEEREITPATIIEDKEIEFPGGYKPHNYDRKFHGKVTARYALANSLNIPAVLVLDKVGVNSAVDFAKELGITTLNDRDRYGLSLVLGAAEVPLIQMTEAYSVFANQGQKVDPTGILEIMDKKGDVIYSYEPSPERVMSSAVAYQISSILSDNKARADTFGGSLTISRPAAVKTGTTEEYRDALTIGYTPQLVIGTWVGNNDRTPMDSVAGSLGAAPIWRQLMEYFLRGKPVVQFEQPDGLIKLDVCRDNGLRAEVATSSAYPEFFLPGTTPKGTCITPSPTPSTSETPTPTPTNEPENTPTPTPTAKPQSTVTPTPETDVTIPPLLRRISPTPTIAAQPQQ